MSEDMKFMIDKVNAMSGTNYNMLSFDSLSATALLQVLCNVLEKLEAAPKMVVERNVKEAVLQIISSLQAVKYDPVFPFTPTELEISLSLGQSIMIYPILFWLLSNEDTVKTRAYLSEYVEKLDIPDEALADSDISSLFSQYETLIDDFWVLYDENVAGSKATGQASEMQQDIKKMSQELATLSQRIDAQNDKINNIPNKEGLLILLRGYRSALLEDNNLNKQGRENIAVVKQLRFQLKTLEEELQTNIMKRPVGTHILPQVNEELEVNRIFHNYQLPEDIDEVERSCVNYDIVLSGTNPLPPFLRRKIALLKDQVQMLVGQKIAGYSKTEDQLGPFRNQAAIIANRKLDVTVSVRELREQVETLDKTIKEKEITLYNLVGGEVLHGDQLKQFIAKLRDKNIEYRQLRLHLQGLSAELGTISRTVDVLKSIDSSVEEALATANESKSDQVESGFPETIAEARQLYREHLKELDNLKAVASQVRDELSTLKAEIEEVSVKCDETKTVFEKGTKFITNEIKTLKDQVLEKNEKIEKCEETWKKITQDYEKCDFLFNRILDDLISKSKEPEKESYCNLLSNKLTELKSAFEACEKGLLTFEKAKEQQRDVVDFLKFTETLIFQKLKQD